MRSIFPGQGFMAYTDFDAQLDSPPSFEILRNSDNALVQEGIGQQDASSPRRWAAPVVMPDEATVGDYTIVWNGKNNDNQFRNAEVISVVSPRTDYVEIDRLFQENQPISDMLLVEDEDIVTIQSVKVLDTDGNIQFTATVAPETIRQGERVFIINFGQGVSPGPGVFASYLVQWNYTLNGLPTTEYHFFYVTTYKVLAYVNELRRMIDKANLQHANPGLKWNDVDLVAFLNMGLQYINSSKPTLTAYGFKTLPDTLFPYLLSAAAIEALDSRYLAESEAAFNFTGQPISIDVDRTGFLESAREHYKEKLDNLASVKKVMILSTGGGGPGSSAGILVLSNSPSLDIGSRWTQSYAYFRPGSRAIFYDTLLSNLL